MLGIVLVKVKVTVMSDSLQPHGLWLPGFSVHGIFPDKNTGVGSCSLLQGIFPIQGSNPGLSHCRWILNQLSHQGSPRILAWSGDYSPVLAHGLQELSHMGLVSPQHVGSSQIRDQTHFPCVGRQILYHWATREAPQMTKFWLQNSYKCSKELILKRTSYV